MKETVGWSTRPKDDPDVVALTEYLEANNGMKALEIVSPDDIECAVRQFHRDGFVVVENVLNDDEIAFLAEGCFEVAHEVVALDTNQKGNRGIQRYSFGGSSLTRSQLHRTEWQMLLENRVADRIVSEIFGSTDYVLRAASGDFCLPGTLDYQRLHADVHDFVDRERSPFSAFIDPTGRMTIRDLPCPYVCVNFLPQEVTRLNGPTRQIPSTQHSHAEIPKLGDEPEWMRLSTVCPAPAGAIMIRDVRAWHGGTPNVSDHIRSIPNLEFYAPWFREPIVPGITRHDYNKLSERARQLARCCVADSGDELIIGATLRAP